MSVWWQKHRRKKRGEGRKDELDLSSSSLLTQKRIKLKRKIFLLARLKALAMAFTSSSSLSVTVFINFFNTAAASWAFKQIFIFFISRPADILFFINFYNQLIFLRMAMKNKYYFLFRPNGHEWMWSVSC